MKKFRGQKRYYRKLLHNDMEVYFSDLDFSWFNMFHYHPDHYGHGNLSWKHRSQHLKALIRQFNYLKARLSNTMTNYQIFCYIDVRDSSHDAIFMHTPNPNQDNFPFQISESEYRGNLSHEFKQFLVTIGCDWFFNKWNRDNEIIWNLYLYDKNFGVPIKKDISR